MNIKKPNQLLFLTLCLLGILLSQSAHAGPAVSQVVGLRTLNFPAPTGFSDFTSESPKLKALAEGSKLPGNRLLAFFISDVTWKKHKEGSDLDLVPVFQVLTPDQFEYLAIRPTDFIQIRAMLRKRYDDQRTEYQQRLNAEYSTSGIVQNVENNLRRSLAVPSLKLKIGETQVLGVVAEGDKYLTAASLTNAAVSANGKTIRRTLLSFSSTVLLNDKVVYLYLTTKYDSEKDIAPAIDVFQSWINQVIQATPQ